MIDKDIPCTHPEGATHCNWCSWKRPALTKFKEVQKDEFCTFVHEYPRRLDYDVTGICEPPLGSYNDFTLGKWPESIVAKMQIMDGSDYYGGEFTKYFLREELICQQNTDSTS